MMSAALRQGRPLTARDGMIAAIARINSGRLAAGNLPEWVAAEAIHYLESRVGGHGGIILLDARGNFGIAHNTPRMAWALKTRSEENRGIKY